jgi:hypothetical protein
VFIRENSRLIVLIREISFISGKVLRESNFHVSALGQVNAFHEAHLAALARHHNRGCARAFAKKANAFHQRAVGYAGRGKDDVICWIQVFGC